MTDLEKMVKAATAESWRISAAVMRGEQIDNRQERQLRAALRALIPPSEETVEAMAKAIWDFTPEGMSVDEVKRGAVLAFTAAIQSILAQGEK